jgi:hypothetical protein
MKGTNAAANLNTAALRKHGCGVHATLPEEFSRRRTPAARHPDQFEEGQFGAGQELLARGYYCVALSLWRCSLIRNPGEDRETT